MPDRLASSVPLGGIDLLAEEAARTDASANLAMEEALVRARPQRPLLRIWQNTQCVVVGRGQRVEREVNLAACAHGGVAVARRASGGGAVYHDLGNLNISMAVPGYAPGLAGELARLVAAAIERLGLPPSICERGVLVGPEKVSGLAEQVTRSGSLAHATLLVTTPAADVVSYLAPAPHDPRPLDSRRVQVRPLCERRPALDIAAARTAVLAAAASRYGALLPRPPRAAEHRWFERLLIERYRDPAWHLTGRPGHPWRGSCSSREFDPRTGRVGGAGPGVPGCGAVTPPRGAWAPCGNEEA
ncbi:MAG TPA: lipoate--protein ligase family protein [Streptosporangiaceae bacterium]|nr:lipoate--protein ligase family protein [Streptosporangiaceae bacterium]